VIDTGNETTSSHQRQQSRERAAHGILTLADHHPIMVANHLQTWEGIPQVQAIDARLTFMKSPDHIGHQRIGLPDVDQSAESTRHLPRSFFVWQ
jgi:hypothetical protein